MKNHHFVAQSWCCHEACLAIYIIYLYRTLIILLCVATICHRAQCHMHVRRCILHSAAPCVCLIPPAIKCTRLSTANSTTRFVIPRRLSHTSCKSNLAILLLRVQLLVLCSCCATSYDIAHTGQYLRAQTLIRVHNAQTAHLVIDKWACHRSSSASGSWFQSSSLRLYRLHLRTFAPTIAGHLARNLLLCLV